MAWRASYQASHLSREADVTATPPESIQPKLTQAPISEPMDLVMVDGAPAIGATSSPTVQTAPESAAPPVIAAAGDGVAGDAAAVRLKRAYMLTLDQGELTLMEQQDIEGDFASRRGNRKQEEWSGMLRCRLLSDANAVLAEELLPAPDHLCAVLDPNVGGSTPVRYTVPGPVVFQIRTPRVQGATRLDVYRIIRPGEPPLETLLGSIPLPRS